MVMFWVWLVVLGAGLVQSQERCSEICRYVYYDPYWERTSDSFFNTVVGGTLGPGIVTAEYKMSDSVSDRFYFFAGSNINAPLFIRFELSSIKLRGQLHGSVRGYVTLNLSPGDFFQISDKEPSHYLIIFGDSDSDQKHAIEYKYGSEDIWNDFQKSNVRLRDTTFLRNYNGVAIFKYISICPDSTPRLCEEKGTTVIQARLGRSYTLICSAAGAPFLTSSWTKDGVFTSSSKVTVDTDRANHKITSTIEISSFTVDHIGKWDCTISNKNFGNSVTKVYEVRYSQEVILDQTPEEDFYTSMEGEYVTLDWKVTGWPLEKVTFNCDTVNKSQINTNTAGYRTTNPPSVRFQLTLQNEDQVLCTVQHGEQVLGTTNITRVGLGCVVGERGVGKDCLVCPLGQTSEPGTSTCFPTTSSCEEGFYGIGHNCSLCPVGESSPVGSVKVQECLKIAHKSGVNVGFVVGASVAGAIAASGLVFLIPKLVKKYRESGDGKNGDGKRTNDIEKHKVASIDQKKSKEKEKDDKAIKTKRGNPDDMIAYKDEVQMYYYGGGASETSAPPPLPPKSSLASKELTRRKSNQHLNRSRRRKTRRKMDGDQACDTAVKRKVSDYIDNTIVPTQDEYYHSEHYYEDLDRKDGSPISSEWSD
ncbi:hypothetical protein ACHWQZ_G012671 [Mnemiopsis leidyi]